MRDIVGFLDDNRTFVVVFVVALQTIRIIYLECKLCWERTERKIMEDENIRMSYELDQRKRPERNHEWTELESQIGL